jgi:hypothetical protein
MDRTWQTIYSGFGPGSANRLNRTSGSGSGSAQKVKNQTELNFGSTTLSSPILFSLFFTKAKQIY